ncbi:SMAD/FHA domain-containing protein isoform X2 [Tasmannia lanceolata]|uniref:SMAD/FHA domain-containing protein isoform X2 n=1 Tax=Tasmannia lanceolata TaxID=3420 RepID=UPI004063086F
MSPSVHRSPPRRYSSNRSDSPVRARQSPRRRSPPRIERSPPRRRSSPRTRSPTRTSSSHRTRSPPKEKLPTQTRSSPKHVRSASPVSRSPSPRTKRLRGAQAEREVEKLRTDRDSERHSNRDGDKGRHRERDVDREVPSERRSMRDVDREVPSERGSMRDRNDGGSSRPRHGRSNSPMDRGHRSRYSSRSPPRASKGGARDEATNQSGAEQFRDEDHDSVAKMKAAEEALEGKQKDKPSFELSGKLAAETNRVRGVTLLFTEPPDARKPDVRWRLYVFKAGEVLNEPLYVHRQSCYLFGRERRVADIPTDHPSCSKQHAVIQFRLVEKEKPDGMLAKLPRIRDLA